MDPQALSLTVRPTDPRVPDGFVGRARRVGLAGVLAAPRRTGRRVEVPGDAAEDGLTWDARDVASSWWYPQGITSSADAAAADEDETVEGRPVLLTSWYGHGALGHALLGSRISVVDLTDRDAPRYDHVLLVAPVRTLGVHRLRRVRVHAGGIVWYGDHLFVAASGGGLKVFRLADIVRMRLRARAAGYRYVLPQLTELSADALPGVRRMTYSFLSLERGETVDHLVAGEYGRRDAPTHRLVRFELDRATGLPRTDSRGVAHPVDGAAEGVPRMQGAVVVDGTWWVTASAGEGNPGDLWVGRPGDLHRHRGVLPTGVEDITWWPSTGRLWSLTEWPGRRWVFPIDADRWGEPASRPR